MLNFLHKLFKPHCEQCREDNVCSSCETLKNQLDIERHRAEELLKVILELTNPTDHVARETEPSELRVMKPRHVSWRVKQEMLQREDRAKGLRALEMASREKEAEELAEGIEKENDNLEKELGVG